MRSARKLTCGIQANYTDDFNRANSSTTLGTASGGLSWTAHTGTWGISSNQGYLVTQSGDSVASLPVGLANVAVTCEVTYAASMDPGIVARVADANNYILVFLGSSNCQLWKRVAGSYTNLQNVAFVPVAGQTYLLGLKCVGTAVTVTINGVAKNSVTEAALTSNTKCGLRLNTAGTGVRYNNFLAVAP